MRLQRVIYRDGMPAPPKTRLRRCSCECRWLRAMRPASDASSRKRLCSRRDASRAAMPRRARCWQSAVAAGAGLVAAGAALLANAAVPSANMAGLLAKAPRSSAMQGAVAGGRWRAWWGPLGVTRRLGCSMRTAHRLEAVPSIRVVSRFGCASFDHLRAPFSIVQQNRAFLATKPRSGTPWKQFNRYDFTDLAFCFE